MEAQVARRTLLPFRSLFPIRYYLNDFEFAVIFEPDSEPSSRTVSGFPFTGIRTCGEYGRKPAPEMLSGAPYCPFRTDIWQLGTMFKLTFGVCVRSHVFFSFSQLSTSQQLRNHSPPLVDLFDSMCSDVPSSRPSAAEALDCVRRLVVSHDILMSHVPQPKQVVLELPLCNEATEATVQ
jgi:hypothetical protein